MLLTKLQFKEELNNAKKRRYSLIFLGMSSSGKTHWSKILCEKFHFNHVEFDDLIGDSEDFADLIKDVHGNTKAAKLGIYFGKPWDDEFKEKERKYLAIERKFMSKEYPPGSILDLTGSAVYHPKELAKLTKKGLVIYLETTKDTHEEMLRRYLNEPKPICWNGNFNKKKGESNKEALIRCFFRLIKDREKLYEKFADVKIKYGVFRNLKSHGKFVQAINKQLA